MIYRILSSAFVVGAFSLVTDVLHQSATVAVGDLAVNQLVNSNTAYITSVAGMHFFSGGTLTVILAIIMAIILVGIWKGPVTNFLKGM